MKASLILANHVEQQGNTVSLLSAGIDRAVFPDGHPGPYIVGLGLALFLNFGDDDPPTVELLLELRGAEEIALVVVPSGQPGGDPSLVPLRLGPMILDAGESGSPNGRSNLNLAFTVANFAIAASGKYEWVALVDGVAVAHARYTVGSAAIANDVAPTGTAWAWPADS